MFAHTPPRPLATVRAGPARWFDQAPASAGGLRRALAALLAVAASARPSLRTPRARLDELSPHLRADLGLPPVGPVTGPSFRGFPGGFVVRPPR